jgi:predicted ArsR family transcriptional regulator
MPKLVQLSIENLAMYTETSDGGLLSLLRQHGPSSIAELISAMGVTATAVRQRLVRLMADGLIERQTSKPPRGRPCHKYSLTEKARRQAGSNFSDLTIALWQEVRQIKDPQVRAGLLKRLAKTMAGLYGGRLRGQSVEERMRDATELMRERNVPFIVEHQRGVNARTSLPVLTAEACPYPDLAEHDRGICAVEKMMFSELVGENLRLSECRLDGSSCCRFETN